CGNADTVGEFPKQRTHAFHPTEFKELTWLRLNSTTVSSWLDNVLGVSSQLAEGIPWIALRNTQTPTAAIIGRDHQRLLACLSRRTTADGGVSVRARRRIELDRL